MSYYQDFRLLKVISLAIVKKTNREKFSRSRKVEKRRDPSIYLRPLRRGEGEARSADRSVQRGGPGKWSLHYCRRKRAGVSLLANIISPAFKQVGHAVLFEPPRYARSTKLHRAFPSLINFDLENSTHARKSQFSNFFREILLEDLEDQGRNELFLRDVNFSFFFISRDTIPLFPLFLESNLLLENLGNYRISHACSFDKISYPSYRAIQRRTKLFEFVTQLWKLAFLPPRYILHIPRIVDRERGGFHPWTGLKLPRRNGEGRSRGPLELFGSTLATPLLLETPRDKKVPRRRGVCPSTNLGWISTRRMLVEEKQKSNKLEIRFSSNERVSSDEIQI